MKNIIIINCYINSFNKKSTLIECITQFKKINIDILLISNSIIDESIQNLVTYYIYDSENTLLPVENSPVIWFADNVETIHLYKKGTSYMCCKHMYMSINFCKLMGYDKFIYSEFDNILHDDDLLLIDNIFNKLNDKKIWLCNSTFYKIKSYETRFFSGKVNYFIENVKLTKSFDEWKNTYPYSSTSDTLEFIFPQIMDGLTEEIYFTDCLVDSFFKKSIIDKFKIYTSVNIVYNNEDPTNPILFIISDGNQYELSINNNIIFDKFIEKNIWIKQSIKISNVDTFIKLKLNNIVIFEECLNVDNILKYKTEAIKYKL